MFGSRFNFNCDSFSPGFRSSLSFNRGFYTVSGVEMSLEELLFHGTWMNLLGSVECPGILFLSSSSELLSLDEGSDFFAGVFVVMAAALPLVTGLAEVDLAPIPESELGSELLSLAVLAATAGLEAYMAILGFSSSLELSSLECVGGLVTTAAGFALTDSSSLELSSSEGES